MILFWTRNTLIQITNCFLTQVKIKSADSYRIQSWRGNWQKKTSSQKLQFGHLEPQANEWLYKLEIYNYKFITRNSAGWHLPVGNHGKAWKGSQSFQTKILLLTNTFHYNVSKEKKLLYISMYALMCIFK